MKKIFLPIRIQPLQSLATMKSVAIVGAGPAGLVAAKNLLATSKDEFRVTIFEEQDRVGGMWALRPGELHRGKCNPEMPTNLSRFTVSFSDLAWQSMNLTREPDGTNGSNGNNGALPLYPKAWQVGRYLEEYAKRYIPPDSLKLGCKVQHARKATEGDKEKWHLQWIGDQQIHDAMFDHLIVGSGFFSSPRPHNIAIESGPKIKLLHSSEFRVLEDLLPEPRPNQGTVVVVGGSMSGAEAAVAVAMSLSNASFSPRGPEAPNYSVVHVTSRPFYDLPRMHPKVSKDLPKDETDHSPGFLPNDLNMFDLSRRPPGRILPSNGLVPPSKANMTHKYMRSIIGNDQSDLQSQGMSISSEEFERPPFLAITDNYTEFVRSGVIVSRKARAKKIQQMNSKNSATLIIQNEDGETESIADVVGLVYATGFTPHTSLEWLDQEIRQDLQEDTHSFRVPLMLHQHAIFNAAHPDLAFVGFYEGPYWGVMEMQAREIARRWSPNATEEESKLNYDEPDLEKLRLAVLQGVSNVPQFWMGDYLGVMEALAERHGIKRNDEGFGHRSGPISAARYSKSTDDQAEVQKSLLDLRNTLTASAEQNRFVSAAIFRGLQGKWSITRNLTSFLPGFPSGTLFGSAYFHPRSPTSQNYDAEYLYIEDGTLNTQNGLTLKANKRYAYRYSEAKDQISVWFVKDDGKTIDYFFHDVTLSPKTTGSHKKGWQAAGTHLCDKDNYDSAYEFRFSGATLQQVTVKFIVKGPKKDYISETRFERLKNK
ncbi:hypothetical protein NA57DRAFT_47139 [Rhizodiscina lignyota]|uniref:FAD/NAD(P)-binding domain-containing protein n=1 Tax=Rhizodiscina lignyota TaxID=1504668 RepID=A0A9P4I2Y7_9PEZI|nr:hypothetical protein NA57DRAFT_47139 [Rhizodiscina lignyota]